MNGLLALAYTAGLLSAVNPCGIAMLPGFLTLYTEPAAQPGIASRLRRGLTVGLALTAGFTAVYATTALLLAAGLRTVLGAVPWLAFAIGLALIGAGIFMLTGRQLALRLPTPARGPQGKRLKAAAAYGAGYAVASLSCTVAILLATTAQALATTGTGGMLTVIAAYTAGAATLLLALAISAAVASSALARLLRQTGRHLNRAAGVLLTVTGLYLAVYWLPALSGGGPNQTLARIAGGTIGKISNLLAEHTTAVAVAALALLAVAVGVTVRSRYRTSAPPATTGDGECCETGDRAADLAAGTSDTGNRR